MVYQMPCPAPDLVFVASSHKDGRQAETEIVEWALTHGYLPPHDAKTFVFYLDGTQAREWHLIERAYLV